MKLKIKHATPAGKHIIMVWFDVKRRAQETKQQSLHGAAQRAVADLSFPL
jgi:hypothetical protein